MARITPKLQMGADKPSARHDFSVRAIPELTPSVIKLEFCKALYLNGPELTITISVEQL